LADECIHGMDADWCGICTRIDDVPRAQLGEYGFRGGESKQDLLNAICDQLGIPREPIGVGSSLPSYVFHVMAARTGVPSGSMPEIGQAVAETAGLTWGPDCDSRGSTSGGGSTVTMDGLRVLDQALARLLSR
jgi:hypothetical protein